MRCVNITKYIALLLGGILFLCCGEYKKHTVSESIREEAKIKLQYALENSSKWEKVHAAEYILNLDYSNNVYDLFLEEEKQNRNEPYYRIGVWRVLNQAAISLEEKTQWLDSISRVYKGYSSLDRIHAAESLAKLRVSPYTISTDITDSILGGDHNPMWAYTYWGTAYTSEKDMDLVINNLLEIILQSKETVLIKKIALYALLKMKNLSVDNWDLLISKTLNEPKSSPLYTSLLTCTLANTPKDSLMSSRVIKCREKLRRQIDSLDNDEIYSLLAVYEDIATEEDLSFLIAKMNKGNDLGNTENVMAAANAILKIDKKR
ncbi:hypothetical protein [Arenibacter latericius]|uniref:hypothetical protein n=1 Tax=Arenibacter latericius TaxID=86104 RepID=UPI0004146147|nr:hypothetical protein [Arenibacter latericius]